MAGISIWQLSIVLVIVVMLFGTKKLRGLGGDLGGAIKGFKDSMAGAGTPQKATVESPEVTDSSELNRQ